MSTAMPTSTRHSLFILALCGASIFVSLQDASAQARFERIGLEDGLPYNSVTSLLQDHRGYMWIGTRAGLGRWDGYDMRVFIADPEDSTSLSNASIWCLFEDHENILWIGTGGGGLNRYTEESESFERFDHDENDPHALSANRVSCVAEDDDERLWIATSGGALERFDRTSKHFAHYRGDRQPHDCGWGIYQRAVLPLKDGRLLVTSVGDGAAVLDPSTGCAVRRLHGVDLRTLPSENVLDAIEDRRGDIWFATSAGLVRLHATQSRLTHFGKKRTSADGVSDTDTYDVFEDRRGHIWIGTASGLDRYDPVTERFSHYYHDPLDPYSLSDNRIYTIAEDRSGNIWVGTQRGVCVLTSMNLELQHFRHTLSPTSLVHDHVSSFAESRDGSIWVGTFGRGICRYDPVSEQFGSRLRGTEEALIFSLYEDDANCLWIGTYGGGLLCYRTDGSGWRTYRANLDANDRLSHNDIHALESDGAGGLWIGTNHGLNHFDPVTDRFRRFLDERLDLLERHVRAICHDGERLWVGSVGGLYYLDSEHRIRKDLPRGAGSVAPPAEQKISSIIEGHDGVLWVGTVGGGLYRLDGGRESWTRYTVDDGLASNSICAVFEDEERRLWITTHGGLSVFSPAWKTWRTVDARDGLLNIQFNPGAALLARNGDMYFGGTNGLSYRRAIVPEQHAYTPPVYLTELRIWNRRVHPKEEGSPLVRPFALTRHIELDHDQNMIGISFAALEFTAPERNRYRYFMEGLHERWIDAGNERTATFTNLDPGEYIFHVTTANRAGAWSDEQTRLFITVHAPFWRTTWAYLVYAVLILGIVFVLVRVRERQIRLQEQLEREHLEAEQLQQLDRMKSNFFSNISHEFRTPLTLILGPTQQIARRVKEDWVQQKTRVITEHADKLLRFVNQILDLSRIEAGHMTVERHPGDIVSLVRHAADSFALLAEEKGIALRFESDMQEAWAEINAEAIDQVMTNFLANAFRFTDRGGEVRVALESTTMQGADGVHVSVRDTGCGIPPANLPHVFDRYYQVREQSRAGGSGIGLALAREWIRLHGGEVQVESELGAGSVFRFVIPVMKPEALRNADAGSNGITLDETTIERSKRSAASSASEPAPEHTIVQRSTPVAADASVSDSGTISDREIADEDDSTSCDDRPLILVVDDHEGLRAYMRDILNESYRILEAEDGQHASDLALIHTPDLIISDVMMPVMDGFALCRTLRADSRCSHIPIIMLTARGDDSSRHEGLETGANDYLTKPFNEDELLLRVGNLLALRQAMAERLAARVAQQPRLALDEKAYVSRDQEFLDAAVALVDARLDDESLAPSDLYEELGMSRSQFQRKIKALTDLSPSRFIRSIRLERARQMLQQRAGSIAEIAYAVGFSSQSYFTSCFRERYGHTPGQIQGTRHAE